MKKFLYLCGMMLISLNMMAQIDPYDRNWDTIVLDDFDQPNRQFDNTFQEPLHNWIAFNLCLWPSGVTISDNRCSIYQWDHCVFDSVNGLLRLNSEFIRDTPIHCDEQPDYYDIPPRTCNLNYSCNPDHSHLYYYSGNIETLPEMDSTSRSDNLPPPRFQYGYFEICCKIPVHRGARSAFWLWDAEKTHFYEEIDIYEFSWEFEDSAAYWQHNPHPHGKGNPYCYSSGLYINKENDSLNPHNNTTSQAREFLMDDDSLSNWHTFACEWLPDHILWYCDGDIVNAYNNPDSIPSHPMTLKMGYSIDRYALKKYKIDGIPVWKDGDCLVIDYIKVQQLNWDCDTDEIITQQSDLEDFVYGVKKSISITSSIAPIDVGSTDNVTFRATDSFAITGPFQIDSGGKMTVIIQSCPE